MTEEGYSRSSEKTRAMDNITKKSSDREMRTMFDMADRENESDTSTLPKIMGNILNNNRFLPHPPPAAAASYLNKKDTCIQQGQSLKRWHSVPRLVTFMPAIDDCPVDLEK
eukprot:646673-Pyramimonas_sp.AAC.1